MSTLRVEYGKATIVTPYIQSGMDVSHHLSKLRDSEINTASSPYLELHLDKVPSNVKILSFDSYNDLSRCTEYLYSSKRGYICLYEGRHSRRPPVFNGKLNENIEHFLIPLVQNPVKFLEENPQVKSLGIDFDHNEHLAKLRSIDASLVFWTSIPERVERRFPGSVIVEYGTSEEEKYNIRQNILELL